MTHTDGSLARQLDFEEGARVPGPGLTSRLRLARPGRLTGPDKYKQLDARRRRAQIRARHLLDLMDAQEEAR